MFETCKRERSNDNAKDVQNTIGVEVSNVESLKTDTLNTAVKRLRMREFLSELSFELVQRLRKSIRLSAFIKL